jgi:hypothetical protein
VQFCKSEAPLILKLNRAIRDQVHAKIHHYGKVNYLWHAAKRVPVAFIPFGVAAVNALGLSKLVVSILSDTGMLRDSEAKKAGAQRSLFLTIRGSKAGNSRPPGTARCHVALHALLLCYRKVPLARL